MYIKRNMLEWGGESDGQQKWEWMSQSVVHTAREVCDFVTVGKKNPKNK